MTHLLFCALHSFKISCSSINSSTDGGTSRLRIASTLEAEANPNFHNIVAANQESCAIVRSRVREGCMARGRGVGEILFMLSKGRGFDHSSRVQEGEDAGKTETIVEGAVQDI